MVRRILDRFAEENNKWLSFPDLKVYSQGYYWVNALVERGVIEVKTEGRRKFYRIKPEYFEVVLKIRNYYRRLIETGVLA